MVVYEAMVALGLDPIVRPTYEKHPDVLKDDRGPKERLRDVMVQFTFMPTPVITGFPFDPAEGEVSKNLKSANDFSKS